METSLLKMMGPGWIYRYRTEFRTRVVSKQRKFIKPDAIMRINVMLSAVDKVNLNKADFNHWLVPKVHIHLH